MRRWTGIEAATAISVAGILIGALALAVTRRAAQGPAGEIACWQHCHPMCAQVVDGRCECFVGGKP